jgi:hypothetical protein
MPTRWCRICCLSVFAVLVIATARASNQKDDATLSNQLRESIERVRTTKGPSMARINAAERLAQLTKAINPKDVDDKTFDNLTSLLNTTDDSVRFWVAASLGNLGPRAKAAVPALLKDINEMDCTMGELTSAGAARMALKRIGVVPPPLPDCKGKWKLPGQAAKAGKSKAG